VKTFIYRLRRDKRYKLHWASLDRALSQTSVTSRIIQNNVNPSQLN